MMTTTSPSDQYDDSTYDYTVNDDGLCRVSLSPVEVMVQTYFHSFICAFGLIGNVLVIVTYVFYKRSKTMTDVYLFNVAVVDLIFILALPFTIYNEQNNWLMGSTACKILRSIYSISLYSEMLLLACISSDRYIAIVQARRSFGTRSRSLLYSRIICALVWVCSLTLTLPTLIYTDRFQEPSPELDTWVCQMSFTLNKTAKFVKILVPSSQMAIGFFLPLLVMVLCYSSILFTLLSAQSSQRHKAIRVVFVVVVVFIVCHLPYNVALLKHTVSLFNERSCASEKIKFKVLATFRSVAYLNCCLNPILYAFIGVKFRSHFRQIMVDLWCFSKKYIYSTRSSRTTSDVCISAIKSTEGSNMSSFSA